jgi:hypothetical protein
LVDIETNDLYPSAGTVLSVQGNAAITALSPKSPARAALFFRSTRDLRVNYMLPNFHL